MSNLVPLGDIVDIKGGGTPDKKVAAFWDGDIPWASVKDFKSGTLDQTVDRITVAGVAASATNIIPAGHIIVPTRMAVGKAAINTIDLAINQDLKALFPKVSVDTRYLYNALLANSEKLLEQATGATVKGIKLDALRGLKIPLPPLEEQKRIAQVLDQADALRRLRTRALDKLNTLGQAIFHEMFGDVLRNEKSWATENIKDVCEAMVDCVNRTAPVVENLTPYRMIRTTNVRHGRVNLETVRYVTSETFKKWNRRLIPAPGDVILTREAPVGEVGVLKEAGVFLGQRLFLYRPEKNRIRAEFLSYQMQSPYFLQQFGQFGSGSTVKHLPLPACQSFDVRVPPIELQESFCATLQKCEDQISIASQQNGAAQSLFASLQHRAFRGEL